MNKKILKHFKKTDPILYNVFRKVGFMEFGKKENEKYFVALCAEIIGQQLSGRVADVIFERFEKLFPKKTITPKYVLKLSHETLRKTGMSNAKAQYIKDLAEKVVTGKVLLEKFELMEDEKVIEELTKIKGIGRWTAEMFLMFTLGREDIFSHGDLGLRKAIINLYQLDNPTREAIEEISMKWSPFRTYACLVLWRSLDNRPKEKV